MSIAKEYLPSESRGGRNDVSLIIVPAEKSLVREYNTLTLIWSVVPPAPKYITTESACILKVAFGAKANWTYCESFGVVWLPQDSLLLPS